MALEHILLGMLRKPASGYDLKAEITQSVGHFWHAELSQIYPTLGRLARDGLLDVRTEPSDKGPPRKVYETTADGHAHLLEWLNSRPAVGTERLEWLAQVWFLDEEPSRALPFFRELRADFARELASLEAIETYWKGTDPSYPDVEVDLFPQFTLALGLRKLRVIVDWCDDCIARLEARHATHDTR